MPPSSSVCRLLAVAVACAAMVSCRAPAEVTLDGTPPAGPSARAESAPREVVVERLPERSRPEAVAAAAPPVENLPAYRRLAYRPPQATSLMDLPATFYTVQLLAASSKEALEAYVRERALTNLSAARIESGGAIYYVLLLGVYPDTNAAKLAAAERPPGTEDATVWVRSLGSVQQGIERANRLTGSAEF